MNRKDNVYEETDADGYTDASGNEIVGSEYLINVVKLMKYIRDHKTIPMKSYCLQNTRQPGTGQ